MKYIKRKKPALNPVWWLKKSGLIFRIEKEKEVFKMAVINPVNDSLTNQEAGLFKSLQAVSDFIELNY
jgi:predicted methyltransferase